MSRKRCQTVATEKWKHMSTEMDTVKMNIEVDIRIEQELSEIAILVLCNILKKLSVSLLLPSEFVAQVTVLTVGYCFE